jgi:hypothetical protein
MNSEHDLIYGGYKVCDIALYQPATATQFFRNYNRIDIQQLHKDVLVQDWSAIFVMPDPDQQLQHFNNIVKWLLELHVPLRKCINKDDLSPWYSFDIEKAMVERNIANRVWRRWRTTADRDRYKDSMRRVNYMVREAKRIYMKRFLDPNLPPKQLWQNFDVVGAKVTTDDNIIFSPDQFNSYFTKPQLITNINSSSGFVLNSNNFSTNINDNDDKSYSSNVRAEFSLNNTYTPEVFNAICQIKTNATGMDGAPIKFLRILLPQVFP